LAIGSGGWFGLGFGQSNQKYLFLPEVHTDSIFAVATEELGFLRMLLVLALLALVVFRGLAIARQAPDSFGRLTAVGISALIAFQALVNVGAMLGVLPLTGVTLPFVSYGGSSMVTLLVATGILLSVSKHRTAIHGNPTV
jgi:cell division protein FtsW